MSPLLYIASDSVQDNTPIIQWPENDDSLVEGKSLISSRHFFMDLDERIGFHRPEAANQVSNHDASGISANHDLRRYSSLTPTVSFALAHQDMISTSKVSHSHHFPPVLSAPHSEPSRPLQAGALASNIAGPSRGTTQTHIPTPHAVPLQRPHRPSPSNSSTTPRLLVTPPGVPKHST